MRVAEEMAIGNDDINWQLIVRKKCRSQSEIIEG
jgi:hypothetical protein